MMASDHQDSDYVPEGTDECDNPGRAGDLDQRGARDDKDSRLT